MNLIMKSHEFCRGGGGTEPLWGRGTHPAGLYTDKPLYVQYMTHYYNAMWIPQNLPVFQCICMKYMRMGGSQDKIKKILNKLVYFKWRLMRN